MEIINSILTFLFMFIVLAVLFISRPKHWAERYTIINLIRFIKDRYGKANR